MPYKDPEKRKAYHKAYMEKYQPEWRKKHPTYNTSYARHWRAENPDKVKEYEAKRPGGYEPRYRTYYEKNKHKVLARKTLQRALKKGLLIKPTNCEMCRLETTLEADHSDYSKPLDVTWLCRPCHLELTVKRNRLGIVI